MKHIIDTDELEKLEVKGSVSSYNQKGEKVTDLWISKAEVLELLANSPQADGMVNADVIEAANDVLDKAYCDCPTSMRYDKGEHYSSCPLFDLNIAMRKLSAYKPQADETYGQDFNLEYTCKRIRRLLNVMGMSDPSNGKDHVLMGMLFTLLGTVCSKLEKPQSDDVPPDVYDIVVDTGDGIYHTAEVVHFQQSGSKRMIQVRLGEPQADDVRKDAEPSDDKLKAMRDFAMSVQLSHDYDWIDYMRDMYFIAIDKARE